MPEFMDLAEYWSTTPPTHVALQELMKVLGYERRPPQSAAEVSPEQQLDELLQAFGAAGGTIIHAKE